jgi:hypothetical protein
MFSTALAKRRLDFLESVYGETSVTSVAPIKCLGANKVQTCPTPFGDKARSDLDANPQQ